MAKNRYQHACSFTQSKHYFSDQFKMSKINLKWSRMGAKIIKIKKKRDMTVKILPSSPTVQQNIYLLLEAS